MPVTVSASPTKDFFVRMITRDISLRDCVLDLIDNSVDAARRQAALAGDGQGSADATLFEGYWAHLSLSEDEFVIEDNCGGMSVEEAEKRAFHFGRLKEVQSDKNAIGLYGIGMKRAIMKIGKRIRVDSDTAEEGFTMNIYVPDWEKRASWDFELDRRDSSGAPGVRITISELNENVDREFGSSGFRSRLKDAIERDYAFIMGKGFEVKVNDSEAMPLEFTYKRSSEISPARISYLDDSGVHVTVTAGMVDAPPDESDAESLESDTRSDVSRFGWWVVCNDRVVLDADRTERTGWGTKSGGDRFPVWHGQYNGFLGVVDFKSEDPEKLPWDTTKRDIDDGSLVYRRALERMKKITRPFLSYTSQRKADLEEARAAEEMAGGVPIDEVQTNESMILPKITRKPKVKVANILYKRPLDRVDKVRAALGDPRMSYTDVGKETFEYYFRNEVGE